MAKGYTVKLPRGLEVDLFNLPEDFDEQIRRTFSEYTAETSEDYRDCDRLGYIDCCIKHLNGDKYPYDVINDKVKDFITYQWEECGQLDNEEDVYNMDFMVNCYEQGWEDATLCSHFGCRDHHIYDEIQRLLVRIIRVVMAYEDERDEKENKKASMTDQQALNIIDIFIGYCSQLAPDELEEVRKKALARTPDYAKPLMERCIKMAENARRERECQK